MQKFKQGDKVIMKGDCTGCVDGQIYTVWIYNDSTRPYLFLENSSSKGCSCQNRWTLINDIDVRKLNKDITTPKTRKKIEALEKKVAELTNKTIADDMPF